MTEQIADDHSLWRSCVAPRAI